MRGFLVQSRAKEQVNNSAAFPKISQKYISQDLNTK